MIKVIGMWELGWSAPITEIDLWQFPLREFQVDEFIMTPISGIKSKKVTEYGSILEALDDNDGIPVVFLDERGGTTLKEFEHPEDCIYVFGKASYSPFIDNATEDDWIVSVETPSDKGMMWPHQVATLVLYDRYRKSL